MRIDLEGLTGRGVGCSGADFQACVQNFHLLHWELMRWARDGGCLELDLGSSCTDVPPTETHPNYGIYRFKSELGARLILCTGYHDRVFAPLRYRIARLLEARAHHVNRRLLGRLRLGALGGREGAPDAAPLPQAS